MSIPLQINHRLSITSLLLLQPVHKHLPTLLLYQVHINNDVASFRSANCNPSIVYSHKQVQGWKVALAIYLVKALKDLNQVWCLWNVNEDGLWFYPLLPSDLPHYVGKSVLLLCLEFLVTKGISAQLSCEESVLLLLWWLWFRIFVIWRIFCEPFWFFEGIWVKALVSLSGLIVKSGLYIEKCTFGRLFPSIIVGLMNSYFTSNSTFLIFLPIFPAYGISDSEGSNSLFFVFKASSIGGFYGFPALSASYLAIASLAASSAF